MCWHRHAGRGRAVGRVVVVISAPAAGFSSFGAKVDCNALLRRPGVTRGGVGADPVVSPH